jgi:hypothetical protein
MSSDDERERGDHRAERGSDRSADRYDSKKFPNYRLVGRNIFDPNVAPKFFKPRSSKMHPYPPQPYHHNPYYNKYPHNMPHSMPPPPFMYKRQPLPPGVTDEKAFREAQKLHFLLKKPGNYRLVGRNIFDPTMKIPSIHPSVKTNKYYDRFIKQHPASHLPLAFQKSVSLAEDKALEEKERQKHKRRKHGKRSDERNDGSSADTDSDSDSDEKAGKIYSDISSGSEMGSSKRKLKKKRDRRRKGKKQPRTKVGLRIAC